MPAGGGTGPGLVPHIDERDKSGGGNLEKKGWSAGDSASEGGEGVNSYGKNQVRGFLLL